MSNKKGKIEPVKFNKFFDEFENVLTENGIIQSEDGERKIPNNNAVIYTDSELVFLTNERLEHKEKITDRTFQGWKAELLKGDESKLDEVIQQRFFRVYKMAILKCKENLFNSLILTGGNGWQRFAWIMERKFSETWGKKEERDDKKDEGDEKQQITITKTYLNEKN